MGATVSTCFRTAFERAALADDLLEAVVGADLVFEVDLLLRQARVELLDALVGERVFERDGHLRRPPATKNCSVVRR